MQARYAGEDQKRVRQRSAVHLVGLLNESFVSHWQHLDEKQRDDVSFYNLVANNFNVIYFKSYFRL